MFRNNRPLSRFEWTEDGHTSIADYRVRDGGYVLPHVETPLAARGTGAAGRLMAAIVVHARAEGIKLKPTCPYAVAWFQRHPDAADVAGAIENK